jgi:transposase
LSQGEQLGKIGPNVGGDRRASRLQQAEMVDNDDRIAVPPDVRQPFVQGRPSVDPKLSIRVLILGYCCGIRSERRLCGEGYLTLAYRWFCGSGLDGDVPDRSSFSQNRHARFRGSDLLRRLFGSVPQRGIEEGLVGEGFAVDASLIQGLRLGREAELAGQGAGYRAAHPGVRQIPAQRWRLLAR